MSKFIIKGGKKLKGTVETSGAKNAALKMMAATILTKEICVLSNVPRIADVNVMVKILESIGAKTRWITKHKIEIDPSRINSYEPDPDLICKMRASIVLAGPLLARFGKAKLAKPGGCIIGARPIHEHWNVLKHLDVEVIDKKKYTLLKTKKLRAAKIFTCLSVTATENAIMASVLAKGKTQIRVAASEPEICDLVQMLRKMGAKISGEETHSIDFIGVNKLKGARHRVLPDRIEAMTLALAGIVTRGNVTIKNIIPDHLDIVLDRFTKAGVKYKLNYHNCHSELVSESQRSRNKFEMTDKNQYADLIIKPSNKFHPIKIDPRPYPGYPTDLQAPTSILMTQLPRTSKIFETIYDDRLKYLTELKKMGAKVKLLDYHTAEISGPTKLHSAKITSFDIRAGATLILAGLIAQGTTQIDKIELIDRGYEKIDEKLRKLGADIIRQNN